jgi:hypothetical protein
MICKKLFLAVGLVGLASQVYAEADENPVVVPLCIPGLPDCDIKWAVSLMAATTCDKHEQGGPAKLQSVVLRRPSSGPGIEQPCKAKAEATAVTE